ncbi:hypothetical protein MMC09_001688 [Bachmanniomyces sp. S44760]|nr:hypothetical protein [Bachmanniomyces sp. S44760]
MADVRSLLRNERASRRINHPQATYSTTGTVVCLVCHIQLKSESLWDSHLKSAQHAMRLQRIKDHTLGRPPGAPEPTAATETTNGHKKRKIDHDDEEAGEDETETRKRAKAQTGPTVGDISNNRTNGTASRPEARSEILSSQPNAQPRQGVNGESAKPIPAESQDSKASVSVDENEWAAFQREVATLPEEDNARTVLTAAATISAAPLTAEEIAARSREEASTQSKEKREAEMEGEKEDAARQLEEEFDEMEELEARVRKLKEKREQIRERIVGDTMTAEREIIDTVRNDAKELEESEDDEDEEEDDLDGWGLR